MFALILSELLINVTSFIGVTKHLTERQQFKMALRASREYIPPLGDLAEASTTPKRRLLGTDRLSLGGKLVCSRPSDVVVDSSDSSCCDDISKPICLFQIQGCQVLPSGNP